MRPHHKGRYRLLRQLLLALLIFMPPLPLFAASQLRLAVASNFISAARDLAFKFEEDHPHKVLISFASSGQLLGQIVNGAPFDMFFSADATYIDKLEARGLTKPDTRFVYAIGQLVLYTPEAGVDVRHRLLGGDFDVLALANPETAPYGRAAYDTLEALDINPETVNRVQGLSVAQAYHFTESGNADLGFVAMAQVVGHNHGSRWLVPDNLYRDINQTAVHLQGGPNQIAAEHFQSFLQSEVARAIIKAHGYKTGM